MAYLRFIDELSKVGLPNVFNPYSDQCEVHDVKDAPVLRARVLAEILYRATQSEVDAIWIGRDLGYRGGRRTGLALTDDVHLNAHSARWGLSGCRATKGEKMAERTAAVIWGELKKLTQPIFLWNVFPFHPHDEGDQFTNRAHTKNERALGEDILADLIKLLRPKRLIAIGNDAGLVARRHEAFANTVQIRHPSYGGKREFVAQTRELYCLSPTTPRQYSFL